MIAIIIQLYILATLDTMFSGICAASGRDARINKRFYFAKAMLIGIAWGQVACATGLVILAVAAYTSGDPQAIVQEMTAVGLRMASVYRPYAIVILITFAIWAFPSVDVRSTTCTIAFGPLTLIRPAVVVLGIAWGLMLKPSLPVVLSAILIAMIMAPFRFWLNLWFSRRDGDQLQMSWRGRVRS